MSTRAWLLAGAFVGVVGSGVAVWNGVTWGLLPLLASTVILWVISRRCTHRYATLLPSVPDSGPERDHARWYCDGCGRTWDAGLASTTRPRLIYNGYDEQKAVKSAMRADTLDKQRRRLATERGGMSRPRLAKPAAASRPGPRPLETLIEQRAVGYGDDARPFVAARRVRK